MICKGILKGLNLDWKTRKPEITLQVEARPEDIERLRDKVLSVELKQYREKRSRDANAYYWVLVGEIARITGDSRNHIHNIMLNRYGEMDTMPDGSLIPFCIRNDIDFLEFSHPHLKPTQKTLSKGDRLFRWCYQIKGSSEYNTAEMSHLINGIVSECREMGIETLPPNEIERMMAAYGRKHHAEG